MFFFRGKCFFNFFLQRECISVHVGQAGCQIGNACWELYCLEHGEHHHFFLYLSSFQQNNVVDLYLFCNFAAHCISWFVHERKCAQPARLHAANHRSSMSPPQCHHRSSMSPPFVLFPFNFLVLYHVPLSHGHV